MSETYWRSTTGTNYSPDTLHGDRDCRHLSKSTVVEADPENHPNKGFCSTCTDKGEAEPQGERSTLYWDMKDKDPEDLGLDPWP